MSLITLGLWISGILLFFSVGISLLPSGADYPMPEIFTTGIQTIWSWMYSLNGIFAVDTFGQVLFYGVLINLVTQYFWPSIDWLFKRIRGTDN